MNFGAILIGLSMLVISVTFVAIPFQQRSKKKHALPVKHMEPEEHRLAVLSSLRDLDFDFQLGKVSEDDYASLRARLMAEAAQSLQEADKVDEVEALIQARKASKAKSPACENCGQAIESGIRFCPRCGTAVKSSCPSCGKNLKAGDLFCSSCGYKLITQAGVAS
ncbi:MAG: hypothetical protein A2X25_11785 [Chloroflexi bacterium GWB2_49_20]|nr:MAG: hypothetical protein A2X25_11785 [Chloroflexi bacterium GWB2_49_20]OGN77686.1 MAG: hypothetical protein A2X26_10055 [Chloroflexi bacterium GWC2_49_37]OGN86461.1 MAG: hypothetical protein A2X27_06210 [Chloroflexi bacterium GWD2_49_16]HBG74706.1 hypothetical protein [Anaerolineae bacterium]